MKNFFTGKYIVLFFFGLCIFSVHLSSHSAGIFHDGDMENLLKNNFSISLLAKQCKSKWKGQGCNEQDQQILMKYIEYFCGTMPMNTHHANQHRFKNYISSPMMNVSFLQVWSWLNNDMRWPICVVCLLNYPRHPFHEQPACIYSS